MPQLVLLGCRPPEALQAVRAGLEAAGHLVETADDIEGVFKAARGGKVALVVVAEQLGGGTGADVCAVLEDLPGHAPLLYVGDLLVPGADAVAPPDDPRRILEQALTMLDGAALIDSLGDVQAASAEDPPETRPSVRVGGNGKAPSAPEPRPKPDKAALEALLRKVREADYFEILGVAAEASEEDVRAAHAALRASLSGAGGVLPKAQLDEAQAAIDEARDVLCEPALRAAYARHRL